jgi:toxin ParE1/3/4
VTETNWKVVVAGTAKSDFDEIVRWTLSRFGTDQAAAYAETLNGALAALKAGPQVLGSRRRDDIGAELFTLHVARGGRRGRHFILFRVVRDDVRALEVLRILHDRMDIARQAFRDE